MMQGITTAKIHAFLNCTGKFDFLGVVGKPLK